MAYVAMKGGSEEGQDYHYLIIGGKLETDDYSRQSDKSVLRLMESPF